MSNAKNKKELKPLTTESRNFWRLLVPEEFKSKDEMLEYKETGIRMIANLKTVPYDIDVKKEWAELTGKEIYEIKDTICKECKYISGTRYADIINRSCTYSDVTGKVRLCFPGIGCIRHHKFKLAVDKKRKPKAMRVKAGG